MPKTTTITEQYEALKAALAEARALPRRRQMEAQNATNRVNAAKEQLVRARSGDGDAKKAAAELDAAEAAIDPRWMLYAEADERLARQAQQAVENFRAEHVATLRAEHAGERDAAYRGLRDLPEEIRARHRRWMTAAQREQEFVTPVGSGTPPTPISGLERLDQLAKSIDPGVVRSPERPLPEPARLVEYRPDDDGRELGFIEAA